MGQRWGKSVREFDRRRRLGAVRWDLRVAAGNRVQRLTLPKVHAKGPNTSASCRHGVATILSTRAFTAEGCRGSASGR